MEALARQSCGGIKGGNDQLRKEMAEGAAQLRRDIREDAAALRAEMHAGDAVLAHLV